jgi:hypothetical protein
MKIQLVCAFATIAGALGPATAEPERAPDDKLEANAQKTLDRMRARDPSLQRFLAEGDAFVVIPDNTKRGVLYENGRPVGRVTVNHAVGAQLVAFYSKYGVERLRARSYRLEASVEPLIVADGIGAKALFVDGIAVFTLEAVPITVVRHQILTPVDR